MIDTVVGGAAVVVLTACFPQDRVLFLDSLALWGGASALAAALLRNFAAYAAALAGYTAAIVAGDLLGATGEINADAAFLLAVTRCSEICVGIVCAGVILAGTDFGGPQRGPEVLATSERAARQRAERFYSPAAAEVERVLGELTKALPIVGGGSRRWRRGWRRHAWGAIPMPNAATHTPSGGFERGRIVFEVDIDRVEAARRRDHCDVWSAQLVDPMHRGTEGLQTRRWRGESAANSSQKLNSRAAAK